MDPDHKQPHTKVSVEGQVLLPLLDLFVLLPQQVAHAALALTVTVPIHNEDRGFMQGVTIMVVGKYSLVLVLGPCGLVSESVRP